MQDEGEGAGSGGMESGLRRKGGPDGKCCGGGGGGKG